MSLYVVESPWASRIISRISDNASARSIAANCLVVVCLTALLTVSDAFQTRSLGEMHQLSLWLVVTLLVVAQLDFVRRIIARKFSRTLAAGILINILSIFCTVVLMTIELHWLKFTPLLPKQPDPLPEFFIFVAPPVISIALIALALRFLSDPMPSHSHFVDEDTAGRRIESGSELGLIINDNQVLHIAADDHYLEIKCEQETYHVRARMKDALQYLQEVSGSQVHRSHWVARGSVQKLFRKGRDYKILLNDGSIVPVARARVNQIRRAYF